MVSTEKIDVFNHIYPESYYNFFPKRPAMMDEQTKRLPELVNMKSRIQVMDRLHISREIISLALPDIDDLELDAERSHEVMRAANNGMHETANQSEGRFLAIGTVSLADPDAAIAEATRCIKELEMLGIQIVSNVHGEPLGSPRFEPFYTAMEELGKPIWIHPTFMRQSYPWLNEFNTSIMVGWDFDTTLAMIHLVGSGVIARHRKLKFVVHHLGSLVPLLGGRISTFLDNNTPGKKQDENSESLSYLKSFYVDTAEGMSMPWIRSALEFFGTDHIMFGTDFPWGDSDQIIQNIESLPISEEDKRAIFNGNSRRIIGF